MLASLPRSQRCLRSTSAPISCNLFARQLRCQSDDANTPKHREAAEPDAQASSPVPQPSIARESQWKSKATQKKSTRQDRQHRHASQRTISLLERLFPTEMKRSRSKATKIYEQWQPIREVPRLALDIDFTVNPESDTLGPASNIDSIPVPRDSVRSRYQNSAVLALRNAGRLLTEDDFRLALPTGEHLEGWTSGGEGMKVIRARNTENMQPNGDYFILFDQPRDARTYMINAQRLHQLAQQWSPAVEHLDAPIPPPPMPEDFESSAAHQGRRSTYADLANYTLLPPSQTRIQIRRVQYPFTPFVRQILDNGGYEPLVCDRKTPHEVLIRADGAQPTLSAIRDAIEEDNRQRGLPWNIANGDSIGVREITLPSGTSNNGDWDQKADESQSAEAAHVQHLWIVSFHDKEEAHRVVAAWHRRDMSPLLGNWEASFLRPEEPLICNAEYIW